MAWHSIWILWNTWNLEFANVEVELILGPSQLGQCSLQRGEFRLKLMWMKSPQWKRRCHRRSSWNRWRWRWPCCRHCSSPRGEMVRLVNEMICMIWLLWKIWNMKMSHLSAEPPLGLSVRFGAFGCRHPPLSTRWIHVMHFASYMPLYWFKIWKGAGAKSANKSNTGWFFNWPPLKK